MADQQIEPAARARLERGGALPTEALARKDYEVKALLLASLMACLAYGCSIAGRVVVHNGTGQPITLRVERDNGKTWDAVLGAGRRKTFYLDPAWAGTLSVGRCDYDYRQAFRGSVHSGPRLISVQIEPDFSIHVLRVGYDLGEPGVFRDELVEGFPLKPVTTCS